MPPAEQNELQGIGTYPVPEAASKCWKEQPGPCRGSKAKRCEPVVNLKARGHMWQWDSEPQAALLKLAVNCLGSTE